MKKIVEDYFTAQGRTVDLSLCEHFTMTRAELFDVVLIHGYTTFDQIIEAHGTGRGCDICKPTVASILASQLNGHVLAKENRKLQDTNDAYLANLQKNGSYSVVPRIPGGEITPEGLIVSGQRSAGNRISCTIGMTNRRFAISSECTWCRASRRRR